MWLAPGRSSDDEEVVTILTSTVAADKHEDMYTALEQMATQHPTEPHWYLAVIGSDPLVRGKGFGQLLMRSRLDRCDAEHAPAYLESSNPVNVPYYERFGFEVTGELKLPGGGPSLIPMWRRPR